MHHVLRPLMSAYRLNTSWFSNNCLFGPKNLTALMKSLRLDISNSQNSGAQTNNLHVEMYSIITFHFRHLSSQMTTLQMYVSGEKSLKVLLLEFQRYSCSESTLHKSNPFILPWRSMFVYNRSVIVLQTSNRDTTTLRRHYDKIYQFRIKVIFQHLD